MSENDRSNQLVVEVFVRDAGRSKEFYRALGSIDVGSERRSVAALS